MLNFKITESKILISSFEYCDWVFSPDRSYNEQKNPKCRMKKGACAKKRLEYHRTLLVCVGLDEHQVWFPSRLIHCVWKAQYNTISQPCNVSDTPFHTLRRDPGRYGPQTALDKVWKSLWSFTDRGRQNEMPKTDFDS